MRTALLALAMLAAGCASPLGIGGFDKDQLAALAKIKDASVVCVEADVMLGANKGSLVMASIDRGISAQIIVDARGKCSVGLAVK